MRHRLAILLVLASVACFPRLSVVGAGETQSHPSTVFPGKTWERRSPGDVGLDAANLRKFADRVKGTGCIVKDGYLVAEWGDQRKKEDWASAAKPVLSTLLMFAVRDGKLSSPDDRVAQVGWQLRPKDQSMTFRHLADMVSGYGRGERPGAAWAYNDYAIELYGRSLQKVFGESLQEAAAKRLSPLQLQDGTLFSSRDGLGVRTTPRDFARIGWFWLNRGRWRDQQLLPADLFDRCCQPGVPADLPRTTSGGTDYLKIGSYGGSTDQTEHGPGVYGFNWWFNAPVRPDGPRVWPAAPPDTYQANGMWNRDVVTVFPSLGIVMAFRGGKLGPFEPGKADGQANGNMKLLVQSLKSRQ